MRRRWSSLRSLGKVEPLDSNFIQKRYHDSFVVIYNELHDKPKNYTNRTWVRHMSVIDTESTDQILSKQVLEETQAAVDSIQSEKAVKAKQFFDASKNPDDSSASIDNPPIVSEGRKQLSKKNRDNVSDVPKISESLEFSNSQEPQEVLNKSSLDGENRNVHPHSSSNKRHTSSQICMII